MTCAANPSLMRPALCTVSGLGRPHTLKATSVACAPSLSVGHIAVSENVARKVGSNFLMGSTLLTRPCMKSADIRGIAQTKAGLLDFLTKPKATKENLREEIKEELLETIKPLERGAEATAEDEEAVESVVQRLEALNPTKAPIRSPLINGKWELLYTTSAGILKKGRPKVLRPRGPIYQCIDTNTLQAQNIETWPYFNQVQATLIPLSESKVDVKFDKFKIGGVVGVKAPESAKGDLTITYLDEDLRIARGSKGNLFVLTMEDPTYTIDN